MSESKLGIGQHRGDGTGAVNSGQKVLRHDPDLGRKPVPASPRNGDINTAREEAE